MPKKIPEDLDLLAMTDEDIHNHVTKLSYDIDACKRRLLTGDDWQRTIQAHLFFDHVLSAMIAEELREPEQMNLDRTAFASKLDLCAALGLIDNQIKSFLKQLNRLRNNIAHDLSFEVVEEHVNELYELSRKEGRELIDEEVKKGSALLYGVFMVNLVFLDIFRQNWAAQRLLEEKRRRHLAAAIENARRVLKETKGDSDEE